MNYVESIKNLYSENNNVTDITKNICDTSIYINYNQIRALHPNKFEQIQQSFEEMRHLLENRTLQKPSNPDIVLSPLHYAVKFEDIEIVMLLLQFAEMTLGLKNLEGDTALHLAAKLKKYPVIQEILLRDPTGSNAVDNLINRDGLSHLHIACMTDSHDIVMKQMWVDYVNSRTATNAPLTLDSKLWPGYTPLHFAVDFGCTLIVKTLISYGAEVCTRNARGLTPLHLAVRRHSDRIIDEILSNYKYPKENPVDDLGLSHFHIACIGRNPLVVRKFLLHEGNVDINCPVDFQAPIWPGYTPLHLAVESGCYETVNILLEKGADVRAIDKSGSTPLHLACSRFNGECETRVIRSMVREKAIQKDSDDELSIDFTDFTHSDIMQRIRESDCENMAFNIINRLIEHDDTQLDVKDELGRTPLLRALGRDLTVILTLVENDVILMKRLISSLDWMRVRLVKTLLRRGADPNVMQLDNYIFGDRQMRLLQLMLNHGYDTNVKMPGGVTLFSLALRKNWTDLLAFLVDRKTDAISRLESEFPIHVIIREQPNRLLNTILISGSDMNIKRRQLANTRPEPRTNGIFPYRIEVLCDIFHRETIELQSLFNLLTGDWDVNIQDDYGSTPLHFVCAHKITEHLEILLSLGGDLNVEDAEGLTPLMRYYQQEFEVPAIGEPEDRPRYRDLDRCYHLLRHHVHVLKTLGLPVSAKNEFCHARMSAVQLSPSAEEEERLFEERCADEARRMREIMISDRASLHDVLFMSPNELAITVGWGGELARVIVDKEFTECSFLLELRYRTAMVRAALLTLAGKAMKVLSRQSLIDDSVHIIFRHLDDDDLKAIIRAANICFAK